MRTEQSSMKQTLEVRENVTNAQAIHMKRIELSDGRIVEMREPKVKDLRLVAHIEDKVEHEIRMFVNLTGLSPDEVEGLFLRDFTKLQDAYIAFLS